MKRAILFTAMLAWLCSLPGLEATTLGTIAGRVIDRDGKAVIGAVVTIDGTQRRAYSKAPDGRFIIAGVPPADYRVTISSFPFYPYPALVRVSSGATSSFEATLQYGCPTPGYILPDDQRHQLHRDRSGTVRGVRPNEEELERWNPDASLIILGPRGELPQSHAWPMSELSPAPDIYRVASFRPLPNVQQSVYGTLTGSVTDDSGKPVIGATIRFGDTRQGGYTKAPDGRFLITGIRAGKYDVTISSVGFSPVTHHVTISADQATELKVVLKISEVKAETVVIAARREPVRHEQATTVRSTTGDDISAPSRASIQGTVELEEGVSAQGVNGYSLRGGRATETQLPAAPSGTAAGDASSAFANGMGGTPSDYYPTAATTVVAEKPAEPVASGEGYKEIVENQFMTSRAEIFSTFSIDVDAASYTNVRRFMSGGLQPPRDAVRIEEMINYFGYDYPQPVDEHPFSITTEMARCPWDESHRLVRIGLQGRRVDQESMPPGNLVFLVDVSGSMVSASKLALIQESLKLLVGQLREEDRVSLVVYAGAAGLVLPATSGARKQEIIAAIDRLEAGGSTAGGQGIELAYKVARDNFLPDGNNRVILATDGDFNVGISSEQELVKLIEEKRQGGIFLTVLGVGTGNYQDANMEQLADHGNGNYYYLDRLEEAQRVLVSELAGTLFTIAKDVKIQVQFNPEKVASYRLIGYENRMLTAEDFTDDRKDAGELGAGHCVTALYEIVPGRAMESRGSGIDLSDNGHGVVDPGMLPPGLDEDEMMAVRLRYKLPADSVSRLIHHPVEAEDRAIDDASEDLRFAAAVAELGLVMRDSKFKGAATLNDVVRLGRSGRGPDADGRRADFVSMVEEYLRTTTTGN